MSLNQIKVNNQVVADVDLIPTKDSSNLISSGGVNKQTSKLEETDNITYIKVSDFSFPKNNLGVGFIYLNTGTTYFSNSGWRYTPYYVKVSPGAIITAHAYDYIDGPAFIACYDNDYNYKKESSCIAPNLTETFEIPQGISYIRVCFPSVFVTNDWKFEINDSYVPIFSFNNTLELKNDIDMLKDNELKYNILSNISGYISTNGQIVKSPSTDPNMYRVFRYSDYIKLEYFDSFIFYNLLQRSDLSYAGIYNSEYNILTTWVYLEGQEYKKYQIDVSTILSTYPGATYIRLCGGSEYNVTRTYLYAVINNQLFNKERSSPTINLWKYYDNIITLGTITATAGYQNPSGSISGEEVDTNWFNTQFIDVKQGDIIKVYNIGGLGTAVMTVGFFDINKSCIVSESYCNAIYTDEVSFEITNENIKYVRFSGSYSRWFKTPGYSVGRISMSLPMSLEENIEYLNDKVEEISNDITTINEEIDDIQRKIEKEEYGMLSDIEHIIMYGQSLSQGDWESNIVSYTLKYNSLMFTGTMRVWEYRDQEHKYDALVPAIETVFTYQSGETPVGATRRGETPCCGTAEKATELIIADGFNINNYQYLILMSAPGMGGYSIGALNKGTAVYNRLLDDVRAGKQLANASGKTYICRGVVWIQGESDCSNTYDYYYNAMKQMFNDLDTDIKSITGQTQTVHFFLYQTWCYDWYYTGFHYPHIPLAQYQICQDMLNVHMVCPIYHMPLIGDYTHFTAEGSKWYGGYIGKVWKKVLIDGEDWNGIYLKSAQVAGNSIILKFNVPNPPLVFDTTNVTDRGISKGFQIRDVDDFEQNSYLDIITNVEIIRPDTIKITCSQNPFGKRLTYAINGTATPSARADMGSGNLRDSCSDVFSFPIVQNGNDVEHKLYNWCPLFDRVLD